MITAFSVKKKNILSLLSLIKKRKTLTKSEMASLTGLTIVTVNNTINDLLAKNIIVEDGSAVSNGGRKAAIYKLNNSGQYIVGVNIAVQRLAVSIFDFELNIVKSHTAFCEVDLMSIDECIFTIRETVNTLLDEAKIEKASVMGVGVVVPGPVNYDCGLIYSLPNLKKWNNIPLKEILENELALPVYVENDNNSSALLLKWSGVLRPNTTCVYLCTTEGIGSGMLINGEIYRGNRGASGEFGHITLNTAGEKCKCGNHGCLELYSSDMAIIKKISEHVKEKKSGILYDLCGGSVSKIDIAMALEAVRLGEEDIWRFFVDAARYIAMCIDTILKVMAPNEIIIENMWLDELKEVFSMLLDRVYENTDFFRRNDVKISLNTVTDTILLSPGAIVLDHLLTNTEDNKLLDLYGKAEENKKTVSV